MFIIISPSILETLYNNIFQKFLLIVRERMRHGGKDVQLLYSSKRFEPNTLYTRRLILPASVSG